MNVPAYLTSLVRTVVPYIVGWLLSLPLAGPVLDALGVDTAKATQVLSALLVFVLGTLYYAVVRALEKKFPGLGVLLGVPAQPVYPGTATAAAGWTPEQIQAALTAPDGYTPGHVGR